MPNNISASAEKVLNVYRKALKEALEEVDMKTLNAIYDEINAVGQTEFSNGWLAATIWMADRYGYHENEFIHDNLEAKDEELRERFIFVDRYAFEKRIEEKE